MQSRRGQVYLLAVVALGLVVVLAGTTLAQSSDPRLGTWKLNLAKSTLAAGTAPKSVTFTIAAAGAGVKVTVETVAADGTTTHWGYTADYDGKGQSRSPAIRARDTVAATRIDANTVKGVYKKDGKVTSRRPLSCLAMGRRLPSQAQARMPRDSPSTSVAVYDKQ